MMLLSYLLIQINQIIFNQQSIILSISNLPPKIIFSFHCFFTFTFLFQFILLIYLLIQNNQILFNQ